MRRSILAALGAASGVAAVAAWWRTHPSACPFAARMLIDVPRPGLSPRRLVDALEPREGQRVLEVGPGTGHFTLAVAGAVGPTGRVDALDIQPDMLDELKRRADDAGVSNVVPLEGDATALPYDDATFDSAFLITVLGEVPDQDAALRELARVVKPGGKVVFGETVLDPHLVTVGALERRGAAAGLELRRRSGAPFAFFAELVRPA